MSARSCDQLCPYYKSTDDQCALMICVATCQCPSVPALNAHPCLLPVPHQCHISVPITATSMPHISAHLSCHLSVSSISASQ
ncbi:unnamed protein product [Staurois parvus]|uniref:Uncharacterized protein n=1 Tax=Staurois parvus TaxID=386267 RepID=A0ABN9B888_9NEOB|nr:unnamed protein product [Staurois parvus]